MELSILENTLQKEMENKLKEKCTFKNETKIKKTKMENKEMQKENENNIVTL